MEACDELEQQGQTNSADWCKALCRSAFRLAQYADALYMSVVAQMKSSDWNTAQAVTAHKRHQVIDQTH